jgi:uncharacterized membrane protein YphA (DoxX/SURF4 family)
MNRWVRQNWPHAGRWLIGLLLLWAGISKLANPVEFLGTVYAYELPLPRGWQKVVAVSLPWAELLLALLLIARVWTRSALVGCLWLMAGFTLATGQAWVRELPIACGCFDLRIFGVTVEGTAWDSVGLAFWRNLVLTGIVAAMLASEGPGPQGAPVVSVTPVSSDSGHRRRRGKRRAARVAA